MVSSKIKRCSKVKVERRGATIKNEKIFDICNFRILICRLHRVNIIKVHKRNWEYKKKGGALKELNC